MRYEKFRNLDFGIVPKGEWPRLMRDLLEFEDMLLLTSKVGFAPSYPFRFEVVNKQPLRQKPIIYPKE